MDRLNRICSASLLFAVGSRVMVLALSPDQRLLPLVPPSAQIVAGMNAPLMHGQPGAFLLVAGNNYADFSDFLALSGVDQTRLIHQLILVGTQRVIGTIAEHSLLASGHFDKAHIFKSAVENGAGLTEYRGVQIAVLSPFTRERENLRDIRWLAVITKSVAILGTIESVREEIDRDLDKVDADPSLVQMLAQLGRDDMSWCLVRKLVQDDVTSRTLTSLDPALAAQIHDGETFLFGINYLQPLAVEYPLLAKVLSRDADSVQFTGPEYSGFPNESSDLFCLGWFSRCGTRGGFSMLLMLYTTQFLLKRE